MSKVARPSIVCLIVVGIGFAGLSCLLPARRTDDAISNWILNLYDMPWGLRESALIPVPYDSFFEGSVELPDGEMRHFVTRPGDDDRILLQQQRESRQEGRKSELCQYDESLRGFPFAIVRLYYRSNIHRLGFPAASEDVSGSYYAPWRFGQVFVWRLVASVMIWFGVLLWARVLMRRAMRRFYANRGRCVECGYDLRGASGTVCSECGATRREGGHHCSAKDSI